MAKSLRIMFFVLLFFVVVPGYLLHYYLAIDSRLIYFCGVVASLGIVAFTDARRFVPRSPYLYIGALMLGLTGSVLSEQISQFMLIVSMLCSLIIVSGFWPDLISPKGVTHINHVAVVILSLAVIGFVYHALGGPVTDTVHLYHESIARQSPLYMTTIGYVRGDFIRPASIFDEPGALSFYLVLVVCFNLALGVRKKISSLLMCTGLLTGSLAHFFLTLVYFLFTGSSLRNATKRLWILPLLFLGAVAIQSYFDVFSFYNDIYGKRLEIKDDGLSGDNRTEGTIAALNYLDRQVLLRGERERPYEDDRQIDLAANPLSPLFGYGIIIWLVYFGLEMWLLKYALMANRQVRFSALALFLILLQRPYIYNFYWTVPIVLVAYTIYKVNKNLSVCHSLRFCHGRSL